jgi:hypothetical protein
MKFQLISFPDGIMGNVGGPYSCRLHDSNMYKMLQTESILQDNFKLTAATAEVSTDPDAVLPTHFSLYGDPGKQASHARSRV